MRSARVSAAAQSGDRSAAAQSGDRDSSAGRRESSGIEYFTGVKYGLRLYGSFGEAGRVHFTTLRYGTD